MIDFLWFVIFSFACYRLAQLIANDDGPLSIFGRLRRLVDNRAKAEQEQGKRLIWQSAADGINCPFCVGIWVAIPLAIILGGIHWYTIIYIFAIAGVQSWLEGMHK